MNLRYRYAVYGISVHSETPLALPQDLGDAAADVEVRPGSVDQFAQLLSTSQLIERTDWFHYAHGSDGSIYAHWQGVGQFVASDDGTRIWCTAEPSASEESFHVYLLGQALSMALVKGGREPLHGTAVARDGRAIALLGGSGFGKSTLAASLLGAGFRLLTDDLLLIRAGRCGPRAQPGPARIKLFPDSARRYLPVAVIGTPMNPLGNKQVIPLDVAQRSSDPATLSVLYVLAPPEEARQARRVRIEPLHGSAAFLSLIRNTFNRLIVDPERLRRQMLEAAQLVRSVPVRKLLYPWGAAHMEEVQAAILRDSGLFQSRSD